MVSAPNLKVATANRLGDGAVVYRDRTGSWSTRFADAVAVEEDLAAELLAAAGRDMDRAIVVGVALIEVARVDGRLQPASLRERIRAFGPSIALAMQPPGGEESR
ncbi:MAG: DUF2849 domain-containing protein [Alphaproteobacteria bacterium]|nr:DUF2849 domain-containing protein [Alphaproteobacteria bacterium]